MIRTHNCQRPPDDFGPGCKILPIPLFQPGAFGTVDLTIFGGVYCPFEFDLYGWWWGVGTLAGGSSPNMDFDLMLKKAVPSSTGFVSSVGGGVTNKASNTSDFLDLTAAPVNAPYVTAGTAFIVGKCVIHVGGVALTALGALSLGVIIRPKSGTPIVALT